MPKPVIPLGDTKKQLRLIDDLDVAAELIRLLQAGETLKMPRNRTMPSVGPHCNELRIRNRKINWRIIYRIDQDAIVIGSMFKKKTGDTPKKEIDKAKKRFKEYDIHRSG